MPSRRFVRRLLRYRQKDLLYLQGKIHHPHIDIRIDLSIDGVDTGFQPGGSLGVMDGAGTA